VTKLLGKNAQERKTKIELKNNKINVKGKPVVLTLVISNVLRFSYVRV